MAAQQKLSLLEQHQQQQEHHHQPPVWANFLAGGLGAMVGGTLTIPLEVVKTRLQGTFNKEGIANSQHRFGTRTLRALAHLYAEGGVRSLYRGLVPHLIGAVPARAFYFGTFSLSKRELVERFQCNPHNMFLNWVSGVMAGVVTITITSPVWVVKTRLQLQVGHAIKKPGASAASNSPASYAISGERHYRGTWHCVSSMLRHEGPRAFFAGMSASYVGISESSVQFMLYEKFKSLAKQRHMRRREAEWEREWESRRRWDNHDGGGGGDERELMKMKELGRVTVSMGPWETLVISSAAKLMASVLTYPHEVVRTRLREEHAKDLYGGFLNCMKVVWRTEGVSGLYGGLMPHLLRVVPNAALMFLTYEAILSLFNPAPSSLDR